MMRAARWLPWALLLVAGNCALPELVIDDELGEDNDAGMGGEDPSETGGKPNGGVGGSTSGKGGKGGTAGSGTEGGGGTAGDQAGGAAGTNPSGGQGGGGTGGDAGANTGGVDTGGTDTGGKGGTTGGTATGGKGGTTGGTNTGGTNTGGTNTGGTATGGRGGMPTGGTTNTGGTSTGGTTNTGGTNTGGTGGVCPSVAQMFPPAGTLGSLDGRLWMYPCADTNSDDCTGAGWIYNGVTTPCAGNSTTQQDFAVGGTPGVVYSASIHFYGILGPKVYGMASGIVREASTTRPTNDNSGATPAPFAYTTSAGAKSIPLTDYETAEIHVLDQSGAIYRQYFLNSDTAEGHWTYVINYERTIQVIGGGHVRVRHYDNNCRMIKNCYNGGQGTAAQCATRARTVTAVTSASPAPTGLVQPGLGNDDGNSGQWLYIDVTSVTCP